jgi:hypothetical protein
MRARALVAITVGFVVAAGPATAGVLITPTKILGERTFEDDAGSNGTYVGWTQNTVNHPRSWNAYVSTDAGVSKTKLNAPGTDGFFGDIDADSNEAIFQMTSGDVSDLYLVDVSDPSTRSLAPDINGAKWEWQPRLSDSHIMFTRNYPRLGVRRLFLYDRSTTALTLLRERPLSVDVLAGDVGDLYATWTVCGRNCTAWVYDIAGLDATKIPTVNRKPQYAPVVDENHQNVYWVRSGPTCGARVQFWTAPVGSLGNAVQVARLQDGFDTGWRTSLEYNSGDNRLDAIFSRYNCRTGDSNIYELQGVDTLS